MIWALPRIGPWCWWMHRSTRARLADMHRLMAWPFLSWCFVHRHLAPDLELLGAKPGGCRLPAVWAAQDRDNVDAVAEAAAVLGWSKNWLRQVSLLAASTICLHTGKRVRQPSEDDFAGVLGQLDDLAPVSPSARHHARTRLFGLQQARYQLGSLSAPPRQSGPAAVGPAVHAAGAPAGDPSRGPALCRHDRHDAAFVHRARADQGAAGVLRLPGRGAPRGNPA